MTESRYLVVGEFGKTEVVKVEGDVRENTVVVPRVYALQFSERVKRIYWDSYAQSPEQAVLNYVHKALDRLKSAQNHVKICEQEVHEALAFKNKWLQDNP